MPEGTGAGTCPWKGKWRHVDVRAGGRDVPSGGWSYHEVTDVTAPVRDFVAFYESKFEIEAS